MAYLPIPTTLEIPSRGPIIPPFEPRYMPVPPSPPGGWGSFAQAPRPSQGPGYTHDSSDDAGPSNGPFVNDDGGDDTDTH